MLASCHIMPHTTYWVIYLVCRSFSPTSEKLYMGPWSQNTLLFNLYNYLLCKIIKRDILYLLLSHCTSVLLSVTIIISFISDLPKQIVVDENGNEIQVVVCETPNVNSKTTATIDASKAQNNPKAGPSTLDIPYALDDISKAAAPSDNVTKTMDSSEAKENSDLVV